MFRTVFNAIVQPRSYRREIKQIIHIPWLFYEEKAPVDQYMVHVAYKASFLFIY